MVVLNNIVNNITPYIMAGGKSSRLGLDKRLIKFNNKSLIIHARDMIFDVFDREPVFVGDNLSELNLNDMVCIPDTRADCGLLGGLISALEHCPTDYAFVLSADRPLLTKTTIVQLLENIDSVNDVTIVQNGEYLEPLIAAYNKKTLPFWRKRLEEETYKLTDGINQLSNHRIDMSENQLELLNINTPDDMKILESHEIENYSDTRR